MHQVSAASHDGLRELTFAMAGRRGRAPARQPRRPRPPGSSCAPRRSTTRASPSRARAERFRVRGEQPERWVRQTDFANDEAVGYLADRLARLGVEAELVELGATAGAEVVIGA